MCNFNKTMNNQIDISSLDLDTSSQKPIYLDFNATTPILPEITEFLSKNLPETGWGNPSSSHVYGKNSKKWLNWARKQVGDMVRAKNPEEEIIFTSGGTEANNWVLNWAANLKSLTCGEEIPHIVTTSIEHPAILQPLKHLKDKKLIEYSMVDPEPETGSVKVEKIVEKIQGNTVFVTVMAANNETGVLQPVEHRRLDILRSS